MTKAGKVYEKLVADIVGTMSPKSKVQYGQWTIGPDGRRDLDVEIRGQIDGENQFVIIECKDWGTPVGIGVVDALDSKRRDIGADYALICSNSGFTSDALRKGKRVGIGMVSVLKAGDQRVKVVIEEEIYTKEIIIEDCKSTCHFHDKSSISKLPKTYTANDVSYVGMPVVNWVAEKYIALVGSNPNAKQINVFYKFREPVFFDFSSVSLLVNAYEISLKIQTNWMSQTISIDASVGMYDFIHHKTIMPPGKQQYILKGIDFDKGKPIDFIPIEKPLELNENRVSLSIMKSGINRIEGADTPNIDSLANEVILTVDGSIAKQRDRLLVEKGTKATSGIEMLVNPIQGERIKLGRNEPCYCGAEKKYKKCHGF